MATIVNLQEVTKDYGQGQALHPVGNVGSSRTIAHADRIQNDVRRGDRLRNRAALAQLPVQRQPVQVRAAHQHIDGIRAPHGLRMRRRQGERARAHRQSRLRVQAPGDGQQRAV